MSSTPIVNKLISLRSYQVSNILCRKFGSRFTGEVLDNGRTLRVSQLPVCSLCQRKMLHLSGLLEATRPKNAKKKIIKPLKVNPKPLKLTTHGVVTIYPEMTVAELAHALGKDVDHVFEVLLYVKDGDKYDAEDSVFENLETIREVVAKSGFKTVVGKKEKVQEKQNKDLVRQPPPPDLSVLIQRPPVVTIMGHVDHGKTSLLDALRKSNTVDKEFGGITQHIGAFSVKLPSGEAITFLDTPGHAAFTAMRARGAQVTDIIILVVAADDGVMQQTIESIEHAKNANVPLIVAINKIDKPDADVERTKKMLLEHDIILEDFGGDVQAVSISAVQGTNLQMLQEAIVTQAELMELKADPKGLVEGRVVEAKTDPLRGKLVTVVVQRGTLKKGCILVAGTASAKVRGMFDDKGKPVSEAPPAAPVEIIGWKELPSAGDEILQVKSESAMKEVIQWRKEQEQARKVDDDQQLIQEKREQHQRLYQEELQLRRQLGMKRSFRKMKEKETIVTHDGPQLSLVLKGDVDGTVDAILDSLDTYNSKKCRLDIVHYGIGSITESDVQLAESFNGEIFAFNVEVPDSVSRIARSKQVPIHVHRVIYKLFDVLKESLNSKLPVVTEEGVTGEAQILQVFQVTDGKKQISVAGCRCLKGTLHRKKNFKIVRGEEVIHKGKISSLKHFKQEVDTIKTDVECGISFADLDSVQFCAGDLIVCYDIIERKQDIDWNPGF